MAVRGDAVDVVVAVDHDRIAVANGPGDAVSGDAGVGQRSGLEQRIERWRQKSPAIGRFGQPAIEQQLCQQRRRFEPAGKLGRRGVLIGDFPALGRCIRAPCRRILQCAWG